MRPFWALLTTWIPIYKTLHSISLPARNRRIVLASFSSVGRHTGLQDKRLMAPSGSATVLRHCWAPPAIPAKDYDQPLRPSSSSSIATISNYVRYGPRCQEAGQRGPGKRPSCPNKRFPAAAPFLSHPYCLLLHPLYLPPVLPPPALSAPPPPPRREPHPLLSPPPSPAADSAHDALVGKSGSLGGLVRLTQRKGGAVGEVAHCEG